VYGILSDTHRALKKKTFSINKKLWQFLEHPRSNLKIRSLSFIRDPGSFSDLSLIRHFSRRHFSPKLQIKSQNKATFTFDFIVLTHSNLSRALYHNQNFNFSARPPTQTIALNQKVKRRHTQEFALSYNLLSVFQIY
jgi:hypothetical protein